MTAHRCAYVLKEMFNLIGYVAPTLGHEYGFKVDNIIVLLSVQKTFNRTLIE